jgi:hypothetical protein
MVNQGFTEAASALAFFATAAVWHSEYRVERNSAVVATTHALVDKSF